ncbi:hypothetical protein KM043_001563 [Ampulex compressa]|nr:hypothetical protein KM043_001563 [Ampulex compressa]
MGSELEADADAWPEMESGAELLARLGKKRPGCRLEDVLFPRGLRAGEIVEITGGASTGKTLLLSRIIAKCILPRRHGEIVVGGCDAKAVLIDAKHHFQPSRLFDIMSGVLRNVEGSPSRRGLDEGAASSVGENSLKNLTIIDCYHGAHLQSYLSSLEAMFLRDDNLALLAIDGINAFYWEGGEVGSVGSMQSHVNKLLDIAQINTSRYGVVTVYTRSRIDDRQAEKLERAKRRKPTKHVAHTIRLRKTRRVRRFVCSLKSEERERRIAYTICADGLRWDGIGHAHENARTTALLE